MRPEYAETGQPVEGIGAFIASEDVIHRMRTVCAAVARLLREAGELVGPGITTDEIDAFVHERTIEAGAYPSTLDYRGYPKSCCTSVNEVICHGIPDSRALLEGDIVNIDISAFLDGVHGDTDATFPVGKIHPDDMALLDETRRCLDAGIAAVRPGRPIADIGRAIEETAGRAGLSVVRAFTGHGIGELFHNGLSVPHHFDPSATLEMEPGMIFTIEPMIAQGTWRHVVWPDGWTALTADGRRTAQYEHTLLVTEAGCEVLTEGGF